MPQLKPMAAATVTTVAEAVTATTIAPVATVAAATGTATVATAAATATACETEFLAQVKLCHEDSSGRKNALKSFDVGVRKFALDMSCGRNAQMSHRSLTVFTLTLSASKL